MDFKGVITNFTTVRFNHFAPMQATKPHTAIAIIKRLKNKLKLKTDVELSKALGVRPNTISTWKKRNSVDNEAIMTLCDSLGLDLNEIFLGKKINTGDTPATSLVSREVQFQYAMEIDSPSFVETLPKFKIPFVNATESRVFQVTSNNMFPHIEENSYVVCEKISAENVMDNSLIVVVSQQKGLFINKIFRNYSNGNFILKSENTFFNEVALKATEISELWLIQSVISYGINYENKFKSVSENSIEEFKNQNNLAK